MITLRNNFHNSSTRIRAKIGDLLDEAQVKRIGKRLCSSRGCGCSDDTGTRGAQDYGLEIVDIGDRGLRTSDTYKVVARNQRGPLFPVGMVVITTAAVDTHGIDRVHDCMRRHASGDRGDANPEDNAVNDNSVARGRGQILSNYNLPDGRLWVITEHDRCATTALLPEHY